MAASLTYGIRQFTARIFGRARWQMTDG